MTEPLLPPLGRAPAVATEPRTPAGVRSRVQAILRYQRLLADHLIFRDAEATLRLYRDALQELNGRMAAAIDSGQDDGFGVMQQRVALLQLSEGANRVRQKLGDSVMAGTKLLSGVARRQLIDDIVQIDRLYTGVGDTLLPVRQAAQFIHKLTTAEDTSLLQHHPSSVARYGVDLIRAGEVSLSMSLATGESPYRAQRRIQAAMSATDYQAERIVRTEFSAAYNGATADESLKLRQAGIQLWNRWCELVDDFTGVPYDNRVAPDSIALHGQITVPGGVFIMPISETVSSKMWLRSWSYSPNRPNDRSCIGAWAPHWADVPAWIFRDGGRHDVDDAMRKDMAGGYVDAGLIKGLKVEATG